MMKGCLRRFLHWGGWTKIFPLPVWAVGCMVCLLTVAMGIYMIRRANRELKILQEKQHGE